MEIDIAYLINEGRAIQNSLLDDKSKGSSYTFHKLSDPDRYYIWKESAIRFLYNYSENDVHRFLKYSEDFENHLFRPSCLSNMIGILEACKAIPSRKLEQLELYKSIDLEIERVEKLEKEYNYQGRTSSGRYGSEESENAFREWYAAASVLFDKCFYPTDDDLSVFQEINNGGNGYELKKEYNRIYTPYQKLLSRVKERRDLKTPRAESIQAPQGPQEKKKEINIFISYSHAEAIWLERLKKHLNVLKKYVSDIKYWEDTQLRGGDRWKEEIEKAINKADVAILLVSTDFLASDFITTDELPPILKKAEDNGTKILPLIVSPCAFTLSELRVFQAINSPDKTLADIASDEAAVERTFLKVIDIIREMSGL